MSAAGATRRFPVMRKIFRYGAIGGFTTGAIIALPPKEMLPDNLLAVRVVMEGIGRLLRCCYVGLTILFDYKMNIKADAVQEDWNTIHTRSAKKLVMLAEVNGGLYVKAGQGFAAMNHLLPPEYWKTMRSLQDAVLTRPYSEVVAVVEHDLQKPLEEVFSEFATQPIASASLAQVHKAKLRETGDDVAVKVQYLDIAQRFDGDIGTINLMFKICGAMFPGYDFSTIINRTEDTLLAELDFIQEAKNNDRCGELLTPKFGDAAITPKVHWDVTKARVMVTDFINGVKITDREGLQRLGISPKFCSKTFVGVFAHQIFQTGFIHADPHPGNVLVHKNPKTGKPQLVVLDHGLYVQINDEQRQFMANLWTAMSSHNTPELKRICKKVGINDWNLLASMFLQHPYEFFDHNKKKATAEDLEVMRWHAADQMSSITEILEGLPKEYGLVLRNINCVRSTNKDLGNPVSRTAEMLRYSLKVSHHDDWWTRTSCLFHLWYHETKDDLIMKYLAWRHPEIVEFMDEVFDMG